MRRGRQPGLPSLSDGVLLERHRACLYQISYGRLPGTPPPRGTRAWSTRYHTAIRLRNLTPLVVRP